MSLRTSESVRNVSSNPGVSMRWTGVPLYLKLKLSISFVPESSLNCVGTRRIDRWWDFYTGSEVMANFNTTTYDT